MSAMEATWWLNEQLEAWLGEKNAADTLTQSVPNNVTSEMGLALLDVADVIRPHPEVVAFLEQVEDEGFLDELPKLDGRAGSAGRHPGLPRHVRHALRRRDRHHEAALERAPQHARARDPRQRRELRAGRRASGASSKGGRRRGRRNRTLLERLRALPDGEQKAEETKRKIDRVRTFIGYREYPKYGMVSRYFVYKQALLEEAARLVQADVLREQEDIFYLTFQELHDVVRTNEVDEELIDRRKDAFKSYEALTPPRVLTSEGEGISGSYRRDDVPAGALVGLPVSAGTVEGRARVILDLAEAPTSKPGDILVTAYTDPSWTPLFVAVKGLVTEVGGLMTHGAVIAREYGLPAVVGRGARDPADRGRAADPRARNGRVRRDPG